MGSHMPSSASERNDMLMNNISDNNKALIFIFRYFNVAKICIFSVMGRINLQTGFEYRFSGYLIQFSKYFFQK